MTGVVGLGNDPLRGHTLTVDGKPAKRERGDYLLPGTGADPVRVQLKGRFLTEHPVLRIDGKEYATGMPTPPFLLVIAFLPLLFVFGGSVLTVVLALLGLIFNAWVVRSKHTETRKVGTILLGFIAAVVLMAFWAFFSTWVLSLFPRS